MKKFSLLLFVAAAFMSGSAYASGGSSEPFFDVPTAYIDLEYTQPEGGDVLYGPKTKFTMLFMNKNVPYYSVDNFYSRIEEDSALPPVPPADAAARQRSATAEPERYAQYTAAATQFNEKNYDAALKLFTPLANGAANSWVAEAALYMIARCHLVMAQKDWDGYSDIADKIDRKTLQTATVDYNTYLQKYPQGLYAPSARDIQRKILYLSGQNAALNNTLKQMMLGIFPNASRQGAVYNAAHVHAVNEFKNFFTGTVDIAHDSPMLIAYAWLGTQPPTTADMATLAAREADFKGYNGLFRYVQALGFYRLKQYQQLLDKTPEQPLANTILSLSTQWLRARAFDNLNQPDNALSALQKIRAIAPSEAIDLDIAYLQINRGNGLWLYTAQSPIGNEKILRNLAIYAFTDAQIQQGLAMANVTGQKRAFLVDELAHRYAFMRQFGKLDGLLAQQQGSTVFSPIKEAVHLLVSNAGNANALLDFGLFFYKNNITPHSIGAEVEILPRCTPCNAAKARLETYMPPIVSLYEATTAMQKTGTPNAAEAKGLHYIVMCMRPYSEFETMCTWNKDWHPSPATVSNDAFKRLHTVYKKSSWAAKTPYKYR